MVCAVKVFLQLLRCLSMSPRCICLSKLEMIKFVATMSAVSSRIATVLVSVLLFNVASGLMASAVPHASVACPHHASSQECSMAQCPMRHSDSPNTADSRTKMVCPTDNAFADAVRVNNVHEGALLWDMGLVYDDELLPAEQAATWADLILPPLLPPPL